MEQRQSFIPSTEPSSGSSGRTSKDPSPVRSIRRITDIKPENLQNTDSNPTISRPGNAQPSNPSTAAVQRALSTSRANGVVNENSSDTVRDGGQWSGQSTPQWPVSPRLKSPPPASTFRSISGRRSDNDYIQSAASSRRSTQPTAGEYGVSTQASQDSSRDLNSSQINVRTLSRGISSQGTGLETVAEGSAPSPPSMASMPSRSDDTKVQSSTSEQNLAQLAETKLNKDPMRNPSVDPAMKLVIDKSETAPPSRATSTSRPSTNLAKRSLTSLTGKSKQAVEPLRTITVETEPVNSTSQIITDRGRDAGSVRTKPSTETIRPKKEKKRPSRKAPSLHAGTTTSKADIFEAKVASAVDEADSSDSDETFVYESNPPEPRHVRHHTRTPSANSLASQMDHFGVRGKHGVRGNSSAMNGKKAMKFSNSIHGNQLEGESASNGRGSTRTTGSTQRHHHIGRHGRNGHASIFDADSPFTQANRGTSPRTITARNSRPNSPHTTNNRLNISQKGPSAGFEVYDDGADDERIPLMGSVRINRNSNRYGRRPSGGHFRVIQVAEDEDIGWWSRIRGCCLLGSILVLVCILVTVFVVVLNRSLEDVEIVQIQNVLASEQELMLDLQVRAINPNLFTITINELDVNLFAESAYVGTTAEWTRESQALRLSFTQRRKPLDMQGRRNSWFPPFQTHDGVDEGTDPIDDPELGAQKMLLGRIFHFDSPLSFDPSPLRHNMESSVGEIRLTKPGNKTEVGGSSRWERVLQHEFNLIVRGVLKYQLPLSSNTRSAKIGSRIAIAPGGDSEAKESTNMHTLQSWHQLSQRDT